MKIFVSVRPDTDADIEALKVFDEHKCEFKLDEGGLDDRYKVAKEMTDKYFSDPYVVKVEEYCVGCTVTCLKKLVEFTPEPKRPPIRIRAISRYAQEE